MNTRNTSRKLLAIASSGFLAATVSNATLGAESVPEKDALAADEAYVLVNVKDRSLTTSSFSLTESGSKIKLSLHDQKGMQLLKVKAGTYVASVGDNSRKKGIRVTPGTVTYIGDWTLKGTQQLRLNDQRITTNKEKVSIRYSVDNLFDFATQNKWVTQYPLHISNTNGVRVSNNWVRAEQNS